MPSRRHSSAIDTSPRRPSSTMRMNTNTGQRPEPETAMNIRALTFDLDDTNGNADVQRTGLGHLFDFSLSAASVGKAKPHPRMFEEACHRAHVSAAELAHIGDEPGTDLVGARNAGVTVIWMNRQGLTTDPGVFCHAQISGMRELLTLPGLD